MQLFRQNLTVVQNFNDVRIKFSLYIVKGEYLNNTNILPILPTN